MEKAVASLWAGTTGNLDDVPVEDIRRFDTEFLDHIDRNHGAIYETIRSTTDLSDESIGQSCYCTE
jgi:F-type H+-transporting ATPase subunit alpha